MTAERPQETKTSASGPKWTRIPMPLWAMLASFGAALLFALTPLWQLALVAGAIGGLLSRRMKWGAIAGCVGTALGWLTYMGINFLTTQSLMLLGQVAGIIFGSISMVGILVLLVTLIGALFGTLGGSIGSGVRILFETRKTR
jgi:hypothetical protein